MLDAESIQNQQRQLVYFFRVGVQTVVASLASQATDTDTCRRAVDAEVFEKTTGTCSNDIRSSQARTCSQPERQELVFPNIGFGFVVATLDHVDPAKTPRHLLAKPNASPHFRKGVLMCDVVEEQAIAEKLLAGAQQEQGVKIEQTGATGCAVPFAGKAAKRVDS